MGSKKKLSLLSKIAIGLWIVVSLLFLLVAVSVNSTKEKEINEPEIIVIEEPLVYFNEEAFEDFFMEEVYKDPTIKQLVDNLAFNWSISYLNYDKQPNFTRIEMLIIFKDEDLAKRYGYHLARMCLFSMIDYARNNDLPFPTDTWGWRVNIANNKGNIVWQGFYNPETKLAEAKQIIF